MVSRKQQYRKKAGQESQLNYMLLNGDYHLHILCEGGYGGYHAYHGYGKRSADALTLADAEPGCLSRGY